MPSVRSLAVLSAVALLLVWAPSASAARGCQAPPGVAAADQYCETLPAAGGSVDPSGRDVARLVAHLPKGVVAELQKYGLLGQVLLALPAGDRTVGGHGRLALDARRVRFEPGVDALLPGPAQNAKAAVEAAAAAGDVNREMGWALGVTLFGLAALSLWGTLRRA
jgi:hypothetical protein